jgi:hypothetical protein
MSCERVDPLRMTMMIKVCDKYTILSRLSRNISGILEVIVEVIVCKLAPFIV